MSFHVLLVDCGTVVVLQLISEKKQLTGTWMKFDCEQRVWKQIKKQEFNLCSSFAKQESQFYILTSATGVTESTTGLRLPMVLITEQPKKCNGTPINFTLIGITSKRTFIKFGDFFAQNNSNLNPLDMLYYIVDGPKILFAHRHTVYVTHRDNNKPGKFKANFTKFASDIGKLKNIRYHWCASETEGRIYLLCSGQLATDPSLHKSLLVKLICEENGDLTCNTNDGGVILQHSYASIISCIHVSFVKTCDGIQFLSTLLTNKGQLLKFENGNLVNFKNIGVTKGKRIEYLETYDQNYIIITDTAGTVSIFDANSLEKDVVDLGHDFYKHVLIGDFLRHGSDQLLLCSTDVDEKTELKKFILTDLGRFHISSQVETSVSDDKDDGGTSLHKAVTALQIRNQAGLKSLNQTEKLCHDKLAIINKTCDNLHKMVLGDQKLILIETCQKIVRDRWVVIADVQNQSDSPVRDVSISLLVVGSAETESYCTKPISRRISSAACEVANNVEPACKKLKTIPATKYTTNAVQIGEITTVSCVSDMPNFVRSDSVTGDILISWINDRNESRCFIAGTVFLKITDITEERLLVDISQDIIGRRNLEALDALQMCVPVDVSSVVIPIGDIPKILTQDMKMVYKNLDEFYIYDRKPGLEYLRIRVISSSKHSAYLEIYVWNLQQLTVIVRSLSNFLPDSARISLKESHQLLMRNTVESILHEASLCKEILDLNVVKESRMEITDDDDKSDLISRTRSVFEKQRSLLTQRIHVLDSSSADMIDRLAQLRENTDSAVMMLLK